ALTEQRVQLATLRASRFFVNSDWVVVHWFKRSGTYGTYEPDGTYRSHSSHTSHTSHRFMGKCLAPASPLPRGRLPGCTRPCAYRSRSAQLSRALRERPCQWSLPAFD